MNRSKYTAIFFISILGIIGYVNSSNGRFILDDKMLVRDNAYIRSFSRFPSLFASDIGSGAGCTAGYFRPIPMLNYTLDYHLWKLDPRGYHLSNIILHILVALCAYWLADIIFAENILSTLVGIFFVIHPIQTEAVSYISSRSELLMGLFSFLCFIFYLKYSVSEPAKRLSSIGFFSLMSLSYIIALLSKETALVVPVLILLYSCAFGKKTKKNALAGLLIAAILYVIFRSTIFQSVPVHMDRFATVVPRIPGIFVALVKYLSLLLFPFGTHMNYGLKFFSFFDPNVLAAAIIVAVLIIYTIKKRKLYPLLFFSAGWFFVTLLPALNIYPLDSYMAERYLYLPSWGFFLALAWGLSRLYKNNKLWCLGLSAFLIVSYSFLTIKQNNYWKDPISLYGATLRQEPDNYRIHEALAGEYYLEGRVNKAIEEYLKAIEINPGYGRAYGNLGNVFCKQGKIKQAVFMYMKAINSRSEKDVIGAAYYNLGNLYLSIGKDSQAVELYRKAVEIIPAMAAAHNNLAVLYYYNKDYGLAVKHYNQARKLGYNVHPDFKKAIDNYAGTTR